jgi:ribosomal protein L7/L12
MSDMQWSELSPLFAQIGARLESLEAQVALLSEKVGIGYMPVAQPVPPEIVALARSGKMLQAIQQYRALTGASLDEARTAVMGL